MTDPFDVVYESYAGDWLDHLPQPPARWCIRCGRPLHARVSQRLGLGPSCLSTMLELPNTKRGKAA